MDQGWNQCTACREEALDEPWQVGRSERARSKSPPQFLLVWLVTLSAELCA